MEKSSTPLGLAPSTWVALAIAVMGIFAIKQYPFQDTRPTDLWVPTHRRLALLANKPSNADAVAQVPVLNDLVTQLHDGAFAPYSEQPLVRAVLLPAVTFAATAGFPFLHVG
jgi:hypothetical protein